jgi:WD40 repeat protein
LGGHTDGILSLDFSPDGKILASGAGDGSIKLWDPFRRTEMHTLEAHTGPVRVVRFSPDAKHLLSGGQDHTLALWNAQTREIENRVEQKANASYVAFLPDSQHFLSSCADVLMLWSLHDTAGRALQKVNGAYFSAIAVNSKGEVAAGTSKGQLFLLDPLRSNILLKSRERLHLQADGNIVDNFVNSLLFLKNGDILIADRQAVWHWNLASDEIRFVARLTAFSLCSLMDDTFILWNNYTEFRVTSPQFRLAFPPPSIQRSQINAVASSPATGLFAVGSGGSWDYITWIPGGPCPIDLYDAKRFEQWAKLDD